jgi:hypothetical protein
MVDIQAKVAIVQAKILSPLSPEEQRQFVPMLLRLVQGHENP